MSEALERVSRIMFAPQNTRLLHFLDPFFEELVWG